MRALCNLACEGLSNTNPTDEYVAELTSRIDAACKQLETGTTNDEATWVPETMEAMNENGESAPPLPPVL